MVTPPEDRPQKLIEEPPLIHITPVYNFLKDMFILSLINFLLKDRIIAVWMKVILRMWWINTKSRIVLVCNVLQSLTLCTSMMRVGYSTLV